MITSEKQIVSYERDKVTSVQCDRCGAETLAPDSGSRFHDGFVRGGTVRSSFGFGSSHDDEDYVWQICDDCTELLLRWFEAAWARMEKERAVG